MPETVAFRRFSPTTLRNGLLDDPFVQYRANGQLWMKSTYKVRKKVGPWVEYYNNGQLSSEGTYKDGVKVK